MSDDGSNDPCGTIHDLHAAYISNSLYPETVFKRAVRKAREALEKDPGNNEWIYVVSPKEVEAQLRALRISKRSITSSPLYGVPFAVKDNIDVENVPTTVGCDSIRYVPDSSAVAVKELMKAGALFVGKTNLDQFATGLVGTRSPFGPVLSSWSDKHVAGGSSSGSATVVARGIVPFALGTDTAGSGRVPAAFNGIVGLKPSVGRVSTTGVYAACKTLDCVSVFALTASDSARVLQVMESKPEGPADVRYQTPSLGPARFPKGDKALRIGIPWELSKTEISQSFLKSFQKHVEFWSGHAHIEEVDMKYMHETAGLLYSDKEGRLGPWLAERYSSMKDAFAADYSDIDPTVRKIVSRAKELVATDTFEGIHKLAKLKSVANAVWDRVDVLLVPSVPLHPTFEEVKAEPITVNSQLGTYTNFVNLLDWSALALPAKNAEEPELPFGVTWIAPSGYEVALINLACEYNDCVPKALGCPESGMKASPEACAIPNCMPDFEETMPIAVVGAHLAGMPLHHELVSARASLQIATKTTGKYKLYALGGTNIPKPALIRTEEGGAAIEIEVYDVPVTTAGKFLLGIPHPLGLGKIECADGTWVTGFIAEPCALDNSEDVTRFGGWRKFRAQA